MSDAPTGGNWFLGWKPSGPLDWIADLRNGAPRGIRWFHPEDCHVTLAFFGRLSSDKVRDVCERLAATPPQRINTIIGKPLLLPSPRRFSALSLAVESEELRNAIAAHRDEWMALAGLPPERRDPLPHLTFARPDRRSLAAQLRAIRKWVEELNPPHDLTVVFEGSMLFTWSEDRTARQFKVVMNAGESTR